MFSTQGGVPVLLWGEPQEAVKRDLLERLQNVSSSTKTCQQADFPRDDARSALAMFDRRLVLKGFGPQPVTEVRTSMLRGVARLASLVGVEEKAAVLQYNGVLPYMIAQSDKTAIGGPIQSASLGAPTRRWCLGESLPQTSPCSLWRVSCDDTILYVHRGWRVHGEERLGRVS